jgi:hypothetical protein
MDHRWGQRVPADVAVVITRDGWMRGMGRISNVSLSGAMLKTALKMPVHATITVSPVGDTRQSEDIVACVVRTEPGSVAIEWRDMASPQIVALIESVTTDAAALETRDPCAA